jgi:hypothetical protein
MNILLQDGLPEDFEGIPISADFRNMIQVEMILQDEELSAAEKTIAALLQLYPEIPQDTEKAVEGLIWFFTRGRLATQGESASHASPKGFDFQQDASYIYAAFFEVYGIRLAYVEYLHWWEFMVLFEGLPETTLIQRIIYWRTADIGQLPKAEQKHIQRMRKLFALKAPQRQSMAIEDIDQRTRDRVNRRFMQATLAAEKAKQAKA